MKLGRHTALAATVAATGLAAPAGAAALVTPGSTAPAHKSLTLVLPLVTHAAGLTRFADAVSTPGSPEYGHYASVGWLERRFGASAETRLRVVGYLRGHGARDVTADATGLFVEARMDVAQAEQVFSTSLSQEHVVAGRGRQAQIRRFVAPATSVVLPKALRRLVTGVVGLDTGPAVGAALPPSSASQRFPVGTASGCSAGVGAGGYTPNEYLDAYDYAPLQQAGLRGQGERVGLIEIGGFKRSDLNAFASCFGLATPPIKVYGPRGLLPADGEATLDLEVLDAVAPDLKSVDVYESASDPADILETIMEPLQRGGFKPQVISISLGGCESQLAPGIGKAGLSAFESALKVVSAAGISVLAASGDSGSAACTTTNATPRTPLAELAVSFPASSPWVTAVGGTNVGLNPQNQLIDQTVWNDGATAPGLAGGGGPSQLFTVPGWQRRAVGGSQRTLPDVAMLADPLPGYDIYCTATVECDGLGWMPLGGTSAATPLAAGGLALVDQLLREHGEQSLGLANPLLYSIGENPGEAAQVFDDVTTGSNDVGPFIRPDQQPFGCCSAGPGYDEASGWGGLNLAAFAQAALAAQPRLVNVSMTLTRKQHPYRSRGVYAEVGCSGACDAGAYVNVRLAGGMSFVAYSELTHLSSRRRRRIKVAFSAAELHVMASALRAHRPITARITGAIFDPSGNVERHTGSKRLRITS